MRTDEYGVSRRAFADQLSIETPEQVALEYPVAGVGSRFVALLLDHLVQFGVVVVVSLLFVIYEAAGGPGLPSLAHKWFVAVLIFAAFLLIWGYFTLFEALWHGQTPGKRAMKLRVIKDSGRQITFFESLARNLVRVVDYLPSLYAAGVVTMLCNRRNKRLGDFAAGTMVIHERVDVQPLLYTGGQPAAQWSASLLAPATSPRTDAWQAAAPAQAMFAPDVLAKLGSADLVVLEAYFARALDLPLETRAAMATRIAAELCGKIGVAVPEGNPERVLEAMATGLRAQWRRF